MVFKKIVLLATYIVGLNAIALPNVRKLRISKMFSDNMVLQRNIRVPVWGWAEPGETVEIKFNGQTVEAVVDGNGKWMLRLEPMKVGGPFEMIVSGKKTVRFKNVMIGDVWLCGGQSNMAWPLRSSKNSSYELANANHPEIRLLSCPIITSQIPQERMLAGKWRECSSEAVGSLDTFLAATFLRN